jgi:RNA polymerase sigma-70 factor, ECF subfamily
MIVTLPSSCPDGRTLDAKSRVWLTRLRAADRDRALAELHDLLMGAARHEVNRRSRSLPQGSGVDLDDLARQSADDALLAILRKLDDFRGDSRFTTWAYKFALLEAGVKMRRRAWQDREVALDADAWLRIADRTGTPDQDAETRELLRAIGVAIETALTPHQRRVLVAITLDDVPIDVLAERLGTTRSALYKTLHDARKRLRVFLADQGYLNLPSSKEATR